METMSIKEIAAGADGVVALSLKLGLSRSAVSQWDRVPAERVLDVERLTGVPREKIRPDLYLREKVSPVDTAEAKEAA
jgi:DNA-binding transcriptional regulator YdaS (Cro superfamily)